MGKKRFWSWVLGLVVAGLIVSHVRWIELDGRHLVDIDGRKVDLAGMIQDQLTAMTRNCQAVTRWEPDDADYLSALNVIRHYSLPQSATGRIISAWSSADWMLIEVEFTDLLPAVVTLHKERGELHIVPHAVWSGSIHPWRAAPWIRDYIARQASGIPPHLLACFEPQSPFFKA
ncbi:MAG: hypothetical protein RL657_2554 [Pseudomonadota bacterium]|jgi:hypothetical protein